MEETFSCPNCSNENRTGAKFCKNCGYHLNGTDIDARDPVKFCPKCKNPNRSSSKFCCVCGHSFIELAFTGPLSAGTILVNRYEIISLIKSGGMGAVYKARDHRMLELCAIKELIGGTFANTEQQEYSIKRFNEEGKMLANLIHSSLPRVTDLFVERGRYYLVMDFIEGKDLDIYLKEQKVIPEKETVKYAVQILDVLDYLHNQKPPIIYRDIKPGNIMLRSRDQRAMLIDFGIARTIQEEGDKKTKIGTPQYSPIEQFKGMAEPRSDIYSLGATLHHLLTGIMPAPMAFQFESITKLNSSLNNDLEKVIIRATQTDVNDRYKSAMEMLEDIKKIKFDEVKKVFPLPIVEVKTAEIKEEALTSEKETPSESTETKKIEQADLPSEGRKVIGIMPQKTTKASKSKTAKEEKSSPPVHPSSSEMALIPAGYFWMGDKDCEYDEKRKEYCELNRKGQHRIQVEAYFIDVTPVTNQQYKIFVEESGYNSEGDWEKCFTQGKEEHPVVNITWYDADNYAKWAGKRLPSEAEWEKASRGSDGRTWPWGNLWDDKKLNSKESGPGCTTAVTKYPRGDSVYGVLDTVGNVWEWTADWYFPYPYDGPYITQEGDKKAIRGGYYTLGKEKCTCSSRTWGFPENKSSFRGFRCARNA